MMKGLYIMDQAPFPSIYTRKIRNEIEKDINIYAVPMTKEDVFANLSILHEVDVIFSGWGAPKLDDDFLQAAPNLQAFFYAAGSVKNIVTDGCWQRNLTVSSAYAANAVPVAEFSLSQILFALKHGWHYSLAIDHKHEYMTKNSDRIPGVYDSTVGIISLGMVGRKVCELLRPFHIRILAYDPLISKEEADNLNVELCSLEDIFQYSDVVSLHAPWLEETEGMISGDHFNMMKPNTTFLNTARGAVVKESEMIEVLKNRNDIMAILDVTYPEPPEANSSLFALPNVVLTPHIAGSEGGERERLGQYMLEEFQRYLKGKPLHWPITSDNVKTLA